MKKQYRAWAEIDLDAVGENVRAIKKHLNGNTMLMGVVKANAYGHGVCQVAEELLKSGVDALAVAFADEAVELRRAGFDVPVLVLGNSTDSDIETIVEFDITPAVSSVEFAKKLSETAQAHGKAVKIHIKVDTGMSRIGFLADREETVDEILEVSDLDGIVVEGMFTHFATADEDDDSYTREQFARFMRLSEKLESRGLFVAVKHVCNSAGLVKFPEMHLDMVRAGIILYGLYPSADFDQSLIDLKLAMSFKSRISHIKKLDKGVSLSYGLTHTLKENSRIGTVSVGYADGFQRCLSGKTQVFVGGCVAKQVGRICMDQCMIDISAVNNINVGDEVTLFGNASEQVHTEAIAQLLGTIGYELVCGVGRRVPRIYIKDGKVLGSVNYLLDT